MKSFCTLLFLCVFLCYNSVSKSDCVTPDFDSGWLSMSSVSPNQPIPTNPTYLEVSHNLGTTELEVQVQVRANGGDIEGIIFNAMGFPQSDDDIDDYSGVVFAYNSNTVRLWAPTRNITGINTDVTGDGKGLIARAGGNGWSDTNSPGLNAQVRVIIWKENFSKANFDSNWFTLTESSPTQESFAIYNHGLGSAPSKVKTLIRVESGVNQGFIFLASTQAQKDARALQGFGGAVVAYDDQKIKLWTPQSNSSGKVIFIGDGWGSENNAQFAGASVGRILAWKSSRYAADYVNTFSMSTANSTYLSQSLPFFVNDIIVQFKSSSGLIFEAMGSSQGTDKKRGKEFLPYGGLTFGYKSNGSEVRVWAPYSAKTTVGNIVSLGTGWTSSPVIESSAIVTIKGWICPRVYSQCLDDQFLNSTFDCESCNCGIGSYQQTCDSNGKCLCKPGFSDIKCSICDSDKFLSSSSCQACNCGKGKLSSSCDSSGNCSCLPFFSDNKCTTCIDGKFGSNCSDDCNCGINGSNSNKCNDEGQCECKTGFSLPKCLTCLPSYFGTNCESCNCGIGSLNSNCSFDNGICNCKPNFIGDKCDSCQDGFYLFNGDCIACNCGIGSFNGTCNDGQCNCIDNFNGLKCDSCKPSYFGSNCQNQCIECGNGKCDEGLNKSGKCICDPGWITGSNGKCEKCSFDTYTDNCTKCNCGVGSIGANCSSSGVCNCKVNFIGDKCDTCQDGFYLSEGTCIPCGCGIGSFNGTCNNGQCNCIGNFNGLKCDSCKPSYFGSNCQNLCQDCSQGKCLDGLNSSGKCVCNDGWALDSNGKCTICASGRFGLSCSKCPDCGNGLCKEGLNEDGSCVCLEGWKNSQTQSPCSVCDSHYTLVNNQCQKCDSSCSECSGILNNQCTKCETGYYLESGYCKSSCSIGKFGDENGICQECNSSCQSCDNLNSCINCKDGYFYFHGSCLSVCPSSTFPDVSICRECNSDCLTCNGTSKNDCLTCKNGLFKQDDNCVSNCNPGYFKNLSTSQCQKCQKYCNDCNNIDTCNICQNGILNFNGKCLETCPTGYYENGGTCKACFSSCKTCSGSEYFQCTSCYSNGALPYLNVNTCVSSCPIGQYLSNGICSECKCNGFSVLCNNQGVCLNCEGNRIGKNCESCSLGYFMTSSGVCQKCSCNGHSDKCTNSTGECIECEDNTSGFNCENCIVGFQKNQNGQCISESDNQKNKTINIVIGILIPSIIICVILSGIYFFVTRRKRNLVSPEMADRTSQFYEIFPRKSSTMTQDAGSTIVNTVYGTEISLPGFLKMKMNEIRMTEEIGAGGSGNVFSGEILNTDIISLFPKDSQKAAIKLVRDIPDLTETENIDNFHQEVSVNHALSFHPNICKLIAYTESPNAIVSPLYQGDLSQLIYNNSLHYTILDVLDMVYHISSALEAIHGIGVSHRDIKPKNILMEPRQGIETRAPGKLSNFPFNLRVCDFGICHVKSSSLVIGLQRMRNQFGMSIRYASPEALSFHSLSIVDHFEDSIDYQKCDIYSLSITIWEICHRTIPWQNMENSEIQQRVTQGQRPSITLEKFDPASHLISELTTSCWNQESKKRPSSAECCNEIFEFARSNPDLSSLKSIAF